MPPRDNPFLREQATAPTAPSDRAAGLLRDDLQDTLAQQRAADVARREDAAREREASADVMDYQGMSWDETGVEVSHAFRRDAGDSLAVRRYQGQRKKEDPLYDPEEDFEAYGIDMRKIVIDVSNKRVTRLAQQWSWENDGAQPSTEQRREWRNQEQQKALLELREALARSAQVEVPFIDDDPEGKTQEMLDWAGDSGVKKTLLPFWAWKESYSHDVYHPIAGEQEVVKNLLAPNETQDAGDLLTKQHGGWDWLHWLSAGAPSPYLMTAWKYGLGTREQVEAIREGETLMDNVDVLGNLNPLFHAGRATGLINEENEEFWKTVAGVPIGFLVVLLEPDIITAATFGLGKIAKGAKGLGAGVEAVQAAHKAQKAAGSVQGLQKARELLEAGAAGAAAGLRGAELGTASTLVKGEELLRAADEADAAIAAGKMDDASQAMAVVAGLQKRLKAVSPGLSDGVTWAVQAKHGQQTWTPSAITSRAIARANQLNQRYRDLAQTAGFAWEKVGATRAQGKFAFQAIHKDPVQARALARAEYQAAQSAAMADHLVRNDLKAYRELLQVMGQERKAARGAGASAARVTAQARTAFNTMQLAKKTMLAAQTPADFAKAEKAFKATQQAFNTTMQQAARLLGANAASILDAELAAAGVRSAGSLRRLKRLATAINGDKALGMTVDPKKFNVALKTVSRASKTQAQGTMAARIYADTLREVGKSFMALAKVKAAGGFAHLPSESSVLRTMKPFTKDGAVARADEVVAGLAQHFDRATLNAFERSGAPGSQLYTQLVQAGRQAQQLDGLAITEMVTNLRKFAEVDRITVAGTGMAQAIRLHEKTLRYGEVAKVLSNWQLAQKVWELVANPAARKLGPMREELQQIGKGVLDQQRLMQRETLEILQKTGKGLDPAARKLAQKRALHDYLTTPGKAFALSWGGQSLVNGATGVPLWVEGMAHLRSLHTAKKLEGSDLLEGLSVMWLPPGIGMDPHLPKLREAAINLVQYGQTTVPSGKKALAAAKAAARNMTWLDFREAMRGVTAAKAGVSARWLEDVEGLRASAFATQLVSQAALMYRGQRAATRLASGTDFKTLKAMESVMFDGAGRTGSQLTKAMEMFAHMGIPPTLRSTTEVNGKKMFQGIAALSDDMSGASSIIPRRWMDLMSENMGNIVKTSEAYAAKAPDPETALANVPGALGRLWRQGLTTGILFPRPRYYANMLVGNFAQVWAETGLVQALRNTSQTLVGMAVHTLSHTGQAAGSSALTARVDAAYRKAMQQAGDGTILGSVTNALLNPYIAAIYDPALMPASKKIRTASGRVLTAGQLRQALLEEGVLSTFASAVLGEQVSRVQAGVSAAGKAKDAAKHPVQLAKKMGAKWADLADWAEQRQRVALFTDLVVNKGMSPQKAGKLTREALYDWGHALGNSSIEAGFLGHILMFYRFWRQALRQGLNILMDPLIRSAGSKASVDDVLNMTGLGTNTFKTARLRHMVMGVEGARVAAEADQSPDFEGAFDEDGRPIPDGEISEREAKLWEMRKVYPWWSHKTTRPFMGNQGLTAEDQAYLMSQYGVQATHSASSIPAFTPMDTTAMLMSAIGMMGSWVPGGREAKAKDSLDMGVKLVTGMMSQPMAEAAQGLVEYFVPTGARFPSKGEKLKRPTERAFFDTMGLAYHSGSENDPEQLLRANAFFVRMGRMVPLFGTDIPYWLDPLLSDPIDRKGVVGGATWALQQWTGFGMETYHDPRLHLEQTGEYGVGREVQRMKREASTMPLSPKARERRDEARELILDRK